MQITVNGMEMELEAGASVLDLLSVRELDPKTVVVELNKDIIVSDKFAETEINDGDHLEVLRFVGGG